MPPKSRCRQGLQKSQAIWLKVGGLLYLADCQFLSGDGLDERKNYLRNIFLGGFTYAVRCNYGEEVKKMIFG